MIEQTGYGWKTDATAASVACKFAWQVQPVQGAAAPTANYILYSKIGAGSYTAMLTVGSAGGLGVFGHAAPTSQPAAPSGDADAKIAAIIAILQGAGLCAT
jgi:hypothetical protein